jgi:hypothetical protein
MKTNGEERLGLALMNSDQQWRLPFARMPLGINYKMSQSHEGLRACQPVKVRSVLQHGIPKGPAYSHLQ